MSMSFPSAYELLQSVGVELTIFIITLALALVLRGTSSSKKKSSPEKVVNAPRSNVHDPHPPPVKKSTKQFHPSVQELPASSLSRKIDAIIQHASRRQSVDAVALYENLRQDGEHTAIKETMCKGEHGPADLYTMLVQCAGRSGRADLIGTLLDDMMLAGIDRSLTFYESTMKLLASKKCYNEALSVCSRLEADGLEPSPVTLSCLVSFAVEVNDSQRAINFFQRLAASSTPSIRAYMTILRVYSRRHDWLESLAVIRDMQQREAPIDSLVLNIALATGVGAGRVEDAKALLQEFSEQKVVDTVSYNTVMKGCAQQKDVDGAIKLLNEMSQLGVKPTSITFNTVMDAAVRSSRLADAWVVLSQMRDAGLAPDKFTCTTLMKGLQGGATSQQLTIVLDLLRNVTAESDRALCSNLFRHIIELAAKVNDPALTTRAVAQMREQRVMLPANDYQRLLQALMKQIDSQVSR